MSRLPLVVIDPGHGGSDPGAVAANGIQESNLNLAIAKAFVQVALERGTFLVHSLRTSDAYVSLEDRAAETNKLKPTAVLSFHCNAAENPKASGFEVWTSPGLTRADALATAIYDALDQIMPYDGRPDFDDGDPDREANFYILRKTEAPAVLIEFGFVSNPGDLDFLDGIGEDIMAEAVADGVEAWLAEAS